MNPDLLRRFLLYSAGLQAEAPFAVDFVKDLLAGCGILFFTIHCSLLFAGFAEIVPIMSISCALSPAFRLYLQDDPYLTN